MTMRRTGARDAATVAVVVALLAAAWWLAAPTRLGGETAYVTTHGSSMAPRFQSGDLAVVRRSADYRVGDVVAYRSDLFDAVTMHRLVAIEDGRYVFKGDNNRWHDPERPTRQDLIGRLVLRVPQGGAWLRPLSDPAALALISFGLLAGGGTAATTRRRRKRAPVPRPGGRFEVFRAMGSLPPPLRVTAALAAGAGALGLVVAVLAWTTPLDAPATAQEGLGGQMRFSYSAEVGRTAAYDTTTARSPDPVFRRLADVVDVRFAYRGSPGSVSVTADLSTPGGWRSSIPLGPARSFTGNEYEGSVRLDLDAFEARAKAAAAITGLPAEPIAIALTPAVETGAGPSFTPSLRLVLSPLQLSLVGDETSMEVTSPAPAERATDGPRALGLPGGGLGARWARIASGVMLLAALASGCAVGLLARRAAADDEVAGIRRRYGSLLVPVRPMPPPSGRPIIDVTTFATLAKLAERYGLLILHWTRGEVETFVVQDEAGVYRYTAAASGRRSARRH